MTPADDERLLGLHAAAVRRFGAEIAADPRRLVPLLSDEAPELRPVIRAFAAALAQGADRPGVASDAMVQAVALAAQVDAATAEQGVRLAARLGGAAPAPAPVAPPAAPQAASEDWVGVSRAVGAPPAATMPTAAPTAAAGPQGLKEMLRNKWVIGAIGAVVLLILYDNNRPAPPPAQQQPSAQPQPAPPGPAGGDALPVLADPQGRQVPVITARAGDQGTAILAMAAVANGARYKVTVILSQQGWGQGMLAVGRMGSAQPESVSAPAAFTPVANGDQRQQLLQARWQHDDLGVGQACVLFGAGRNQAPGQDFPLRGSDICLLAGPGDNHCGALVGCAVVQ